MWICVTYSLDENINENKCEYIFFLNIEEIILIL